MLIFYSLIILLSCASFSKSITDVESYYETIKAKNQKFCSTLPAWCECKKRSHVTSDRRFSCSNEHFENYVAIDISHDEYSETTTIDCIYVSSFKLIPDLTYLYGGSNIELTNCRMPKNESIHQLTSKISKNIKQLDIQFKIHLRFDYNYFEGFQTSEFLNIDFNEKIATNLNLDNNYFKGLISLEKLKIDLDETNTINIAANAFEYLDNLKSLILRNLPLPIGIFDTLKELQHLEIRSEIHKEFKGSYFKNLTNLVELQISCEIAYCSFDSFIIGNLINLESLKMKGVKTPRIMIANMMNIKIVQISRVDCETFNEDIFNNSTNIEEIGIEYINLKSLSKNIFQHQIKIKELWLKATQLTELLDGTFDKTENIIWLDLSNNRLTSISRFIFAKLQRLTQLHLNNNEIKTIDNSFKNLRNLQVIYLQHNQLSHNKMYNLFDNLTYLVEIDLSYNNLDQLNVSNKTLLKKLKILNLSHNNFSNITYWSITTIYHDSVIDFSYNKFTEINVKHLFLQLRITYENAWDDPITKIQLHLVGNPFNCDCDAVDLVQFIKNERQLDKIYRYLKIDSINLRCKTPYDLHDRRLSDLSITELFCDIEENCPKECECKRVAYNTIIFDCSSSHLQEIPTLPKFDDQNSSKVELYAANNQIHSIELHSIPNNLKLLDLRNNSLQTITKNVIKRFESIYKLYLSMNPWTCDCNSVELVYFFHYYRSKIVDGDAMICDNLHDRYLKKLSITELFCDIQKDCPKECECKRVAYNTIILNCSSSHLQEIPTLPKFDDQNSSKVELYADNNKIHSIQLHSIPDGLTILDLRNNSLQTITNNVIKRFESIDKLYLSMNPWICDCNLEELVFFFHYYRSKIVDGDAMMCSDHQPFKLLEKTKMCVQLSQIIVVFLIVTLLLGLFSITCLLFKKEIKIWLYAHNCCLGWVSEEEADKDMIYDAFFVFSHHDDNFVTDMIIDLEEKGFKCCVHHRDWAAGEMIVTLALQSIKTSRRIIVVLSPMFIQSNWATWEFRVALIHAFNQKRSRVLVIIYGDVSLIDDLDDDLKTYIAYNTYLDSEDMWFDEKLLYAMPHRTVPAVQPRRLTSSTPRTEDDDISNLSNYSIEHIDIDIESDTMSNSI